MRVRDFALTIKVLEVGQLDSLAHAQHVAGAAETIEEHPHVAGVQSRDLVGSFGTRMAKVLKGVLNVCPCSNDRAHNHQAK